MACYTYERNVFDLAMDLKAVGKKMELDFPSLASAATATYRDDYLVLKGQFDDGSVVESVLKAMELKKYIDGSWRYLVYAERKRLIWQLFRDGYQKAIGADEEFEKAKTLEEATRRYYSYFDDDDDDDNNNNSK